MMIDCLTDRPCAVCKYHTGKGCTAWECVFEKEPKTGKWIETGNTGYIDIDNTILYQEMCDKCKGLAYFRKSDDKLVGAIICPNCGAKMEG